MFFRKLNMSLLLWVVQKSKKKIGNKNINHKKCVNPNRTGFVKKKSV